MKELESQINHIVAATDFSINSELAVRRAAQIAQKTGATLHLLHVVHPLEIYPDLMLTFNDHLKDYQRLKKANGLESLDQLAIEIRKDFGLRVVTSSRIGRAHVQIVAFIEEQPVDLVVMGCHGETNIVEAMIGSTASRVLNKTSCNILVVKSKGTSPYERVIAAVDLSAGSFHTASMACVVAPNTPVEILHIFDLQKEVWSKDIDMTEAEVEKFYDEAMKHVDAELNKLVTKLNHSGLNFMVRNGYSPQVINARAVEANADLVVIGRNSKNTIEEFMLGSVSKTVLEMVNCDVLLT